MSSRTSRTTRRPLCLLEHRWAIDLRDATVRAGGFPMDGFIDPLDLVAVGLMAAEEAEALAASPS